MKIEKPQKEEKNKPFEYVKSGTVCLVSDGDEDFYAIYISGNVDPILYDLEEQTYYSDVDNYILIKIFENSILKIQ